MKSKTSQLGEVNGQRQDWNRSTTYLSIAIVLLAQPPPRSKPQNQQLPVLIIWSLLQKLGGKKRQTAAKIISDSGKKKIPPRPLELM